ncbi:hypothetical protein PM082_003839 [Marasmius tenuissimus]|nr:hypothetical protein PM082_003839 [Marasmius tenuissimus]
MGIPGLLKVCEPAKETTTLKELAVRKGYLPNKRNERSLRLGAGLSVLLNDCKAACVADGTLTLTESLIRALARFNEAPVALVFVSDGANRPTLIHNLPVQPQDPVVLDEVKRLLAAFSYPMITAPGDADSFLATLAEVGMIDGVIADDGSDLLVLGVPLLLRKTPRPNSLGLSYDVYSSDAIEEATGLNHSGLIFATLLGGCDYAAGCIPRCGIKTATEIAGRTSLGEELLREYRTLASIPEYMERCLQLWRQRLRIELHHNPYGNHLKRRPCIAAAIPDNFPDLKVVEYYSGRLAPRIPPTMNGLFRPRTPDLLELVAICRTDLGWTDETTYKRFKTDRVWKGIILRVLSSPFVYYDRNSKVFHERIFRLPLLETGGQHESSEGVLSVFVTFDVGHLVSLMGLVLPCKHTPMLRIWVPKAILEVAQG